MTLAIICLTLLTSTSAAFIAGWYGRTVSDKLTYIYYRLRKAETEAVPFGSVRPEPADRSVSIGAMIAKAKENDTQVVRNLTPRQIKYKKQQEFYAKHPNL